MVSAKSVLAELKACGVTHVVGLADNASAALVSLLAGDDSVRYIGVTREGEAFALASGLWIGGKTAVVVVQNTGFLESGDGLRGTAQRMRIPLVCLITYRGYEEMRRQKAVAGTKPWTIEEFSRADLDSAAIVTEPTLEAWNLPFDFLETDADLPRIAQAFSRALRESRPVVLLVTENMT
ncbi:MAG: thiamine pyrophosphate-binding protein [Candidatus Aminicenantales bacterium]|jgi:sulfopyruvate decarboxylase subunit alpha